MRKRFEELILGEMTGFNRRMVGCIIVTAASAMALGCSSEPPTPELTAAAASAQVSQRWAQDEMNHFTVSLHSDSLIECGVKNDLWKMVETTDRGYKRAAYQLTDKGNKAFFAIDLKESGKGHEITLRGPYRLEVTQIKPGSEPDTRNVDFRWDIDWDKAPAELKACVPKFEMSGNLVGLFRLNGLEWKFISYSKPDASPAHP